MNKAKVKQMMAESVLIRETALESFVNKIKGKSFLEASAALEAVGALGMSDLKEKVLAGDISVESLDIKEDEKSKEAADEEEIKEAAEDDKTEMEKVVSVMESFSKRLEKLEAAEEDEKSKESAEDEDDKSKENAGPGTQGINEDDSKVKSASSNPKSGDESNADETSGDDVTTNTDTNPDTGKMPTSKQAGDSVTSGEDPKTGKFPESAEGDDAKEDEQPKPPVVKESVNDYKLDIRKESVTTRSAERFNNLFN